MDEAYSMCEKLEALTTVVNLFVQDSFESH